MLWRERMAPISASSLVRAVKPLPHSRGSALFAKGFRPFFLCAGAFASLSIPLWLAALQGRVDVGAYAGAMPWHAHEMLFGFATAVIAGFLLTAVGNWTGRETATGGALLVLVFLWLAGRAGMLGAGWLSPIVVAALDVMFLPALAVTLAVPVLAARNRRNYSVIGFVLVLTGGNVLFHWSALTGRAEVNLRSLLVAIDAIVLLIAVIGGRVIPAFTRNATRIETIRNSPIADRVTMVILALVVCADAFPVPSLWFAALLSVAGVASAARARHWGANYTADDPLLWVLHVGYAWVPIGLLLRAGAFMFGTNPFPPLHALTVGAIGTLTLGMMARVSLGHTGRLLRAPASAATAFVMVTLAAIVRVAGPLMVPGASATAVTLSGVLWSTAFAAFVIGYARILVQPRVDGKPG